MVTTTSLFVYSFFFNDTATTEIYTLSLHDALPISDRHRAHPVLHRAARRFFGGELRSEEHTSELQSHHDLVCRLLLEKKNKNQNCTFPAQKGSRTVTMANYWLQA